MTLRRKTPEGKDEIVKVSLLRMALGQEGFRLALIILVFSMHPVGRSVLSSFGFKFPDEQKIAVVATEAQGAKNELSQLSAGVLKLHEDVDAVKDDVAALKANFAITNNKLDKLSVDFTGFQVTFNKKAQ